MPKKPIRPIRVEGDIAFVPLTQGKEAVIDAADAAWIGEHNWFAWRPGRSRTFYAVTNIKQDGKARPVLMHREIAKTPHGLDTDHEDGDGLNNRRNNLRTATRSENMRNAKLRSDSTSGLKGAQKHYDHWQCKIRIDGVQTHIGFFDTPEEAHAAYCEASAKHHGKFGRTE